VSFVAGRCGGNTPTGPFEKISPVFFDLGDNASIFCKEQSEKEGDFHRTYLSWLKVLVFPDQLKFEWGLLIATFLGLNRFMPNAVSLMTSVNPFSSLPLVKISLT
jgi:hypothetical protein